jgi:hypothetical protein
LPTGRQYIGIELDSEYFYPSFPRGVDDAYVPARLKASLSAVL